MRQLVTLWTLLILMTFSLSSHAQSVGPKAGINIASWGGDDQFDDDFFKSITAFQFGAVAVIPVNEMVSLQPELLFFQKGLGTESEFLGVTTTTRTNLNYLEIPVLARIILVESPTQIFATVGPSFGFGIGGKSVRKTGSIEEETDVDFEEDELSPFDFSFSIGAGAQMPLGPGEAFAEVRYLLGLANVDDGPPSDEIDIFNRGLGFSVGFLFPIAE